MQRLQIGDQSQVQGLSNSAEHGSARPELDVAVDQDLMQEFSSLLDQISKRVSTRRDLNEIIKVATSIEAHKPKIDKLEDDSKALKSNGKSKQDSFEKITDSSAAPEESAVELVKDEAATGETQDAAPNTDTSNTEDSSEAAERALKQLADNQETETKIEGQEQALANQIAELKQIKTEENPADNLNQQSAGPQVPFAQAVKTQDAPAQEIKEAQSEPPKNLSNQQQMAFDKAIQAQANGKESKPAVASDALEVVSNLISARAAKPDAGLDPKANTKAAFENSLVPPLEQSVPRAQDSALQSVLLKGMLDGLKIKSPESVNARPNFGNFITGISASGQGRVAERSRQSESARNPRNIPLPDQQRALEKVQQVIKEIAQAKDGKSISVRLDPPNLGTLKVDVSLRDGILHARIVPELSQVGYMLRERAHELQSSLRRLGIDAEEVRVSIGSESSTEGFNFEANSNASSGQQEFVFEKGSFESGLAAAVKDQFGAGKLPAQTTLDHWVA